MSNSAEYLPVDGRSSNVDFTSESLLSQDEKDYVFKAKRPTQRRLNLALKGLLLLLVLVFHAGLIALLARWLLPTIPTASNSLENVGSEVVHTIEGSPRDPTKDPTAEFLQTDPCGNSAEEARARGCRFGMLYGAWLPEACYDKETEENFKNHKDWKFYRQPNRTEEVSWDEAEKGEFEYLLVEWEYHQRHCAEMNRRLFTAVSRRGLHTIDSFLSQWRHTDHCAHSAMEVKPMHELAGILWRKFPDCGLIRWKNES